MEIMKWEDGIKNPPPIDQDRDSLGYKFKESKGVFCNITFTNGRTIHVFGWFIKSVTRPKEPIKITYQHFIPGAKHPEDFSGYTQVSLDMKFIQSIKYLSPH